MDAEAIVAAKAAADAAADAAAGTDDNTIEYETYNGMQVQKGTTELINKRVAAERTTLKKQFSTIESKYNDAATQLEEMRIATMSDKEKIEFNELTKKKELEILTAERDSNFNLFKDNKIDTELFKEVSKYDVFNPVQVVALLKAQGIDFQKGEDGNYNPLINISGAANTVESAVKIYLEDAANSNLIRSTLKTGTGTRTNNSSSTTSTRTDFKRSDLSDPAISKEYHENMKNGIEVKIID